MRAVVDTGVIVSRMLLPESVPARAVSRVLAEGRILASDAVFEELVDVLSRPKFDAYVSISEREHFLRLLSRIVEWVPVHHRIEACRDPKDDRFLELAVNGSADVIISGDADLMALHPFRGIPIVSPADFLTET